MNDLKAVDNTPVAPSSVEQDKAKIVIPVSSSDKAPEAEGPKQP
jgi:hypothetical protein